MISAASASLGSRISLRRPLSSMCKPSSERAATPSPLPTDYSYDRPDWVGVLQLNGKNVVKSFVDDPAVGTDGSIHTIRYVPDSDGLPTALRIFPNGSIISEATFNLNTDTVGFSGSRRLLVSDAYRVIVDNRLHCVYLRPPNPRGCGVDVTVINTANIDHSWSRAYLFLSDQDQSGSSFGHYIVNDTLGINLRFSNSASGREPSFYHLSLNISSGELLIPILQFNISDPYPWDIYSTETESDVWFSAGSSLFRIDKKADNEVHLFSLPGSNIDSFFTGFGGRAMGIFRDTSTGTQALMDMSDLRIAPFPSSPGIRFATVPFMSNDQLFLIGASSNYPYASIIGQITFSGTIPSRIGFSDIPSTRFGDGPDNFSSLLYGRPSPFGAVTQSQFGFFNEDSWYAEVVGQAYQYQPIGVRCGQSIGALELPMGEYKPLSVTGTPWPKTVVPLLGVLPNALSFFTPVGEMRWQLDKVCGAPPSPMPSLAASTSPSPSAGHSPLPDPESDSLGLILGLIGAGVGVVLLIAILIYIWSKQNQGKKESEIELTGMASPEGLPRKDYIPLSDF